MRDLEQKYNPETWNKRLEDLKQLQKEKDERNVQKQEDLKKDLQREKMSVSNLKAMMEANEENYKAEIKWLKSEIHGAGKDNATRSMHDKGLLGQVHEGQKVITALRKDLEIIETEYREQQAYHQQEMEEEVNKVRKKAKGELETEKKRIREQYELEKAALAPTQPYTDQRELRFRPARYESPAGILHDESESITTTSKERSRSANPNQGKSMSGNAETMAVTAAAVNLFDKMMDRVAEDKRHGGRKTRQTDSDEDSANDCRPHVLEADKFESERIVPIYPMGINEFERKFLEDMVNQAGGPNRGKKWLKHWNEIELVQDIEELKHTGKFGSFESKVVRWLWQGIEKVHPRKNDKLKADQQLRLTQGQNMFTSRQLWFAYKQSIEGIDADTKVAKTKYANIALEGCETNTFLLEERWNALQLDCKDIITDDYLETVLRKAMTDNHHLKTAMEPYIRGIHGKDKKPPCLETLVDILTSHNVSQESINASEHIHMKAGIQTPIAAFPAAQPTTPRRPGVCNAWRNKGHCPAYD